MHPELSGNKNVASLSALADRGNIMVNVIGA